MYKLLTVSMLVAAVLAGSRPVAADG